MAAAATRRAGSARVRLQPKPRIVVPGDGGATEHKFRERTRASRVQHGGGDLLPLGVMRINALAEMTPVPPEALLNERGERCAELPAPLPGGTQAFDLDAQCSYGRVCLISTGGRGEHSAAQVWFQDLGCTWCFLANSFTDYFRLMVLHLGLPRWQYAYTEVGLDPIARQWARSVAPERLALVPGTNGRIDAEQSRGYLLGAVLGRAGHFCTSVCEFSGRFARCAWCRVTGECCSESICVRLFGSQVGRAARRTQPRASVECPAVVRTVPCWFCSSALGGCNAGGQRVVGREKRAYIFAARLRNT